MKPNNLKIYTFVDGDLSIDINVSIEERNVYMNQTEIAKLLDVNQSTISRKLKNYDSSKWDSYAETQHFCIDVMQKAVDYYGLKIIKEIGQKYNPKRIQKLEEWLEQIIVENSQEAIDDNFEIVRYNQGKVSLPARVDYIHRTAWLAQEEIAKLFDVTAKSISYHIANIYEEEELDKESTLQEIWIVRFEGNRKIKRLVTHYNVDIMIAIGYRVHSKAAINH